MRYLALPIICAFSMTAIVASANPDHSDAALRQLQDATTYQRSGQHLLNLAALRNLRDADLRPLFLQFAQHPEWTVQVHAVLGLAELSEEGVVDPWLVQQVAPSARVTPPPIGNVICAAPVARLYISRSEFPLSPIVNLLLPACRIKIKQLSICFRESRIK